MNIVTAEVVKQIGTIVRAYWPDVIRAERLAVTQEVLSISSTRLSNNELGISLGTIHIRLSIDGSLSVYNTDPESDEESMTIELLERKTIRKTVTYDIEIAVCGNETEEELFELATINDYQKDVTNHTCKMEVV